MPHERTVVTRKPRCRVPRCQRDAECRGVCRSCYQSAYQLVAAGAITWKELEDRGKVDRTETAKQWFLG